jgi:hypothetical protein
LYHHDHKIAEHFYYIPLDVPTDSLHINEGQAGKFFKLEDIAAMKELTWWSREVLPLLERHVKESEAA